MVRPIVISPDLYKEFFPGYRPKDSEEFHEASARLADKWFESAVKLVPVNVILLAGGTASGKTEYLSQFLKIYGKRGGIFYDGTLSTFLGAENKVRTIKENKRNMEVHFIIPKNINEAYLAFLNRKRKFNDTHFYRTHSFARKTMLEVSQKNPDVNIRIIESKVIGGKNMTFEEKWFSSHHKKIDFLFKIQYSEKEIIHLVSSSM